ncbi:hypothetical protein INN71_08820 [Nocardioides sp. ChNu-153]|uniref:hypothetical protein n=1 Tax=Nocardioides sp. ChNu-153 TaxID=2779364 RepID=UPI00264EA83F|nr:hypothetical protein [Nocardioides sp. ChNu-153]MDN7121491.1 hypothetical protein [Nocardioides sp. ChNu-153]
MSDWETYVRAHPRLVGPDTAVTVGEPYAWDRGAVDALPVLSGLLTSATVTPVVVGSKDAELLAWDGPAGRRGWLCRPPQGELPVDVLPLHQELWRSWGGIINVFGAPTHENTYGGDDTWWSPNHREVLTASSAADERTFVEAVELYAWAWEDEDLQVPIDPAEFALVAKEANGNLTAAHRRTGEVVMFAPDHAYAGVSQREGCPPFSLYTVDGGADLAAWIELAAGQWVA